MNAFSPGTWTVEHGVAAGSFTIWGQRDGREACIASRGPWESYADTSRANGDLISAAPDLLAALTELITIRAEAERAVLLTEDRDIAEIVKWQHRWIAAFKTARAVVAKATGSAPG